MRKTSKPTIDLTNLKDSKDVSSKMKSEKNTPKYFIKGI